MENVISPPVRVLDFGYQAPNPLDYQRAASASFEPLLRAAEVAHQNQNQFLLNQINNQKQLELAKWQHSAQIQREQLRDQRLMQVAQLRAGAQMDYLKEKGNLDDIKSKATYLTSRLGGDPIARKDGESDAAFSARLDDAIKNKLQNNIQADTKAAYSIRQQIDKYNQFINDPRVSQAVGGEVQQALQNPGVQAQAQNYINTNFDTWLDRVANENDAAAIRGALQRAPGQRAAIIQRAGLADAYQNFVGSATQQAALSYMKVAGSPAAKTFASANENLKMLQQQYQNISMMPGDNGRMVPKTWWPQVQNATDDLYLHDRQTASAQSPDPKAAALPQKATVAVQNPIVAAPAPGFDGHGMALNTAPFARLGRGVWNFFDPSAGETFNTPYNFGQKPAPSFTEADIAAARAANPGFIRGLFSPMYLPRAIGSLFDSSIDPEDSLRTGDARYSPLMVPPEVAAKIAAARAANAQRPTPAPATNVMTAPSVPAQPATAPVGNGVTLPAMPILAPVPAGASISPFAAVNPTVAPSPGTWQNPYDEVQQAMQQRATMAAMYGQ
jgi:hypothetical protein